jgi:hypothetical protein
MTSRPFSTWLGTEGDWNTLAVLNHLRSSVGRQDEPHRAALGTARIAWGLDWPQSPSPLAIRRIIGAADSMCANSASI